MSEAFGAWRLAVGQNANARELAHNGQRIAHNELGRRLLPMLASVLLAGGCTSLPVRDAPSRPLLAPSTLGADRAVSQVVRGAFGDREATLQCAVSVQGEEMTVVGLTTLGVRAFTLRYDGRAISNEQKLPAPSQLTPERLIADLQLVFWPLSALTDPLQAAGWDVTEPFAGTRRLRRAGRLVAEVHYDGEDPWRGRAWLANLEHDYTLSIESQAQ